MTALPALGSGLDAEPIVARLLSQAGVQKVPSPKLTLFIRRGFLEPDLCAAMIERIDAVRRPSTIADANGDAAFRTSETGDLDAADPLAGPNLLAEVMFGKFGLHLPLHRPKKRSPDFRHTGVLCATSRQTKGNRRSNNARPH